MTLAAGSTLGPYQIVSQLGQGGMGVVYQAHDPRLDRSVAIKLLPPDLTRDEIAKQRFLQEAKAASALDHPNICTIHEINETGDGQLYLVMAHYEGETLKDRISKGPLDLNDAINISTQVGEGLVEAHKAGIVHRDIKPANLLITKTGVVKILDFGLAKLAGSEGVTQTGTTVGTVAYMSPEQAKGQEVDHRTDIWSLGVVLYEMLAGTPPFAGENLLSLSNAILDGEPSSLTGASSSAHSVVTKALNKNKAKRYLSVKDLLTEMRALRSGSDAATVATPSKADVPSIAVLPFDDMSPQKDQAYFCEGMAEEIINALTRLQGLHVSSRTSAFLAKANKFDIAQIGSRLNVKTVLEGSVRKAGNRLRVTAQLIKVGDGYHLWSERYDRDMDDVFAVQDEIAQSVVEKLRVQLLGQRDEPLVKPAKNVEAYELFLRARHAWQDSSEQGLATALKYLEQALVLQPDYAEAVAGIAETYALQSVVGLVSPKEFMPQARQLALKAVAMDEQLAVGHFVLGLVLHNHDCDWSQAERVYLRAIELDPGLMEAHTWLSLLLSHTGRHEEATARAKSAIQVNPIDPVATNQLATALVFARKYDAACGQCRRILEKEPTLSAAHYNLANALMYLGKYDEALNACAQALKHLPNEPYTLSAYGWLCGVIGRRQEAENIVARLQQRRSEGYCSALVLAQCYVGLGDTDRAIEWCETAYDDRDGFSPWMGHWPSLDPLRSDPRFQALLRKMNFPTA